MNNKKSPTALIILDGFGKAPASDKNAISLANTPNLDSIFSTYPNTTLSCSGEAVGLPDGQMGNSEVGHLNIGAGRIIYQELSRITNSIKDKSFFNNPELLKAINHCKENDSCLHLGGLLSDGGVHSHITHLFALLDMAKMNGLTKVAIHCYLDGRDVPPRSALSYFEELEKYIDKIGIGKITTISGRYYAMDRDKRWERVQLAYDALTLGKGNHASSPEEAINQSYNNDISDEFFVPCCIEDITVNDNDSFIMFNFRPDRAREITRAFVDQDFDGFERKKKIDNLCYITMTTYDATIENVDIAFKPQSYKNTLGEYISSLGLHQLRIAETEKYAHVTFFFNGGVEAPNPLEDRILIPSPQVPTYDMQPEMSAYLVKDELLQQIDRDYYDLIILNFANCDMVGHTGVIDAATKAVEAVDTCVGEIVNTILEKHGKILLTADHGNADDMIDENGNPLTAHSMNDVPLVYIAKDASMLLDDGKLCDIAPTLLSMMNIKQPIEMTGHSLLK